MTSDVTFQHTLFFTKRSVDVDVIARVDTETAHVEILSVRTSVSGRDHATTRETRERLAKVALEHAIEMWECAS